MSAAAPSPVAPPAERAWVLVDEAAPRSADAALVGGKASRLLQLRSLGAPVPPFVVVTTAAFRQVVGADRVVLDGVSRLGDEMGRAAGADPARLRALSEEIAARIRILGCPDGLALELRDALALRGLGRSRLAVRSSAVVEDSARHSFAGLLDTELGVDAESLPDAVVRVWASAFSSRALAYRSRLGIGLAGLATAVVVQELVDAAVSGVLFTRHPDDPGTVVVSGAPGLGEGVVQGTAACDTWRVSRVDGSIERERVPGSPAILEDDEIRHLVSRALEIERALEGPQDVEWALDSRRRLHVLQARPVTVASARTSPARGEPRLFDNANVVESYPGLTRPLTFSFALEAYERAFRRAAKGLVPFASPLERRPHLFESLIALVDGRVYYNLPAWYEIFSCLARPDAHRRSWDRHLGVAHDEDPSAPPAAPLGARLQALVGVGLVLLGVRGLGRRFTRRFAALQARFRDPVPAGATPERLCRTYRALAESAGAFWHLTLYNDLCAMRYQDALDALVRRWLPGRPGVAGTLLAAGGPMESLAPVESLRALAAAVEPEPQAARLLDADDARAAWGALVGGIASPSLRRALLAHVDAFGERCVEELKLETPTLREEPWRLLALLRAAREPGAAGRGAAEDERRREAQRLVAGLSLPQRLALRFVLRRARLALRQREGMRLARARLYGLARRLFRRLGDELWACGVLRRPEDVFDLTTQEVLGFVEGTGVTRDLHALVDLRRREYEAFARASLPGRLQTIGSPALALARRAPLPPVAAEGGVESIAARTLRGVGCAGGVGRGPARVVRDPAREPPGCGEVLVAETTDPGWVFLMTSAAGLVAERGSPLSHTAIVGRELGIPTVVGVAQATTALLGGEEVTVDGDRGEVRW
jgi:rifampicin phosphotransferase